MPEGLNLNSRQESEKVPFGATDELIWTHATKVEIIIWHSTSTEGEVTIRFPQSDNIPTQDERGTPLPDHQKVDVVSLDEM